MTEESAITTLHIVLDGDPNVGKSLVLLLQAVLGPQYISDVPWTPWIDISLGYYNTAATTKSIDGRQYRIVYTTAPGTWSRYIHLNAHVRLVCFSLVDLESYENVRTKWYPALRDANQDATVFLVGTKADLRQENINGTRRDFTGGGMDVITEEQVLAMQKEIGATQYFESPWTTSNAAAERMFNETIQAAITVAKRRRTEVDIRSKKSISCIIV